MLWKPLSEGLLMEKRFWMNRVFSLTPDLSRVLMREKIFCPTASAVLIVLIVFQLMLSEANAQSEKLIVIEHADSLLGRAIEGEQAQELIGNVRFSQDRIRVACDHAIQFRTSGNVQLIGNVIVQDDSLTMRFPRGMYYRTERRAVAYDSVQLDDGKVTLTARFGEYQVELRRAFFKTQVAAKDKDSRLTSDSLIYYRNEQRTIAMSSVEIISYADNMTIRGNHFESWRNEQYSRMTESPVLVKFDTSSASARIDTLVVRSKVMEAYQDSSRKLIATDSVEIIRADLASVCGLAKFYTKGDSIMLRKSPIVWYQRTQVSGDSINVYLKTRKLDVVRVMGNAFSIAQSDSIRKDKFDQITGEEMKMHFGEKGLEQMEVLNRAISVYHLYEDSLANGLNKTSGDRILMLWVYDPVGENRKLSSIKVFGGVEGQYFPENLTQGKETEFSIAGFVWREEKPVLRESDFSKRVLSDKFIKPSARLKEKVIKKK